jgi:hypothetical protein
MQGWAAVPLRMRILIHAPKAWSKRCVYAALGMDQAIISFVGADDIVTPSMVSAGSRTSTV